LEFDALVTKKKATKSNDLQKFKPEILEFITEEIVSRYYYQKGRLESSFANDAEIKEAVAILKDNNRYKTILSEGYEIKLVDYEGGDLEEEMIMEEE
jgi:carboxyl-terminal processing protease